MDAHLRASKDAHLRDAHLLNNMREILEKFNNLGFRPVPVRENIPLIKDIFKNYSIYISKKSLNTFLSRYLNITKEWTIYPDSALDVFVLDIDTRKKRILKQLEKILKLRIVEILQYAPHRKTKRGYHIFIRAPLRAVKDYIEVYIR